MTNMYEQPITKMYEQKPITGVLVVGSVIAGGGDVGAGSGVHAGVLVVGSRSAGGGGCGAGAGAAAAAAAAAAARP